MPGGFFWPSEDQVTEVKEALEQNLLGMYKTRRGDVVHVVYIIPEEDAKVVTRFSFTEHRVPYRVVGYMVANLQADTWKYPSGAWSDTENRNPRDLVEYLGVSNVG